MADQHAYKPPHHAKLVNHNLDKPLFNTLSKPSLNSPVLVEGLPGFGSVGKLAAKLLIEFTRAEIFAELYSPSFPDYVNVDKQGIARPPRFEFSSAHFGKTEFMILTGDGQPARDDIVAHYQVCDEILNFAEQFGCKYLATMGGMPQSSPAGEVYVAATSPQLAVETMEKGAVLYKGRIVGAAGLLLGLAKERGWNGVCLLGATTGMKADKNAAFNVFKFLMRLFGVEEGLNNK
jgi:proteasome assembly chaperone (PAC2) family protein